MAISPSHQSDKLSFTLENWIICLFVKVIVHFDSEVENAWAVVVLIQAKESLNSSRSVNVSWQLANYINHFSLQDIPTHQIL